MPWLRARSRRLVPIAAGTALAMASGTAVAADLPSCAPAVEGQLYVSHQANASDDNCGTFELPFKTIGRGLLALKEKQGTTLNLRGGIYRGVEVKGLHGADGEPPLTIRAYRGERVSLDASYRRFRNHAADSWRPAKEVDSHAVDGEYISSAPLARVNRGAFVDGKRHIRLITYGRVRDFRADNQRFCTTKQLDRHPSWPEVTDKKGVSKGYRRAWTYMGPGLWYDKARHRVHIRLSPTDNGVSGLKDYVGAVDPRHVRLALSRASDLSLWVHGSSNLRFEHLAIRHGGEDTVKLENVTGVTFDHVGIYSAKHGVRTNKATATTFAHARFLGGIPDWLFRSDLKSGYYFVRDGKTVGNNLAAQTSRALLLGAGNDAGTRVHHSEFRNGHDIYLAGNRVEFDHNWIDNLNDEALLLDAYPARDVQIHRNVITRSLSALSLADDAMGGPYSIYRNLIDLRPPTAGNRPRCNGMGNPLRYGHLYKSNPPDGPWELFQNTFILSAQLKEKFDAAFTHFADTRNPALHRALNNVFVAVSRPEEPVGAIVLIPPRSTPLAVTDGNAYFRIGGRGGLYRLLPSLEFRDTLEDVQDDTDYELHGIEGDPGFRRLAADGLPDPTDDLRLKTDGLAATHGVKLPDALADLDPWDVPSSPSIGAYPRGDGRLRVGVNGRRVFPRSG